MISRRVSILVLGPILTKWNKNWSKFELRLDNFTPIFIPTFRGRKWKRINLLYWTCLFFFPNLNVWVQIGKCLDYVPVFFKKQDIKPSNIEQTQHAGREGEQEKVRMCCLEATVCFSSAIDGQSVSAVMLPFEFPVFLCGAGNLTCIFGTLHLQMSTRTCMWNMRSCGAQDSVNRGRRLSSNDWPSHYL
jgi:hypothetical protein